MVIVHNIKDEYGSEMNDGNMRPGGEVKVADTHTQSKTHTYSICNYHFSPIGQCVVWSLSFHNKNEIFLFAQ